MLNMQTITQNVIIKQFFIRHSTVLPDNPSPENPNNSSLDIPLSLPDNPSPENFRLNCWNNFQAIKRQMATDAKKMYDAEAVHLEWRGKPDVEKEKFRTGKEMVKEKVVKEKCKTPKIVCSVNCFLKNTKDRRSEIEEWVSDSPFIGLMKMNEGILIKKEVFEDLIQRFDHSKCTIKINGDEHEITPHDFVEIMGITEGPEQLDIKPVEVESYKALFDKFGSTAKKNVKQDEHYVDYKKVIDCIRNGTGEEAKRAFNLFALMRVLVPNGRNRFPAKYLHIIDTCHCMKWAQHVIDQMADGIKSYRNSKAGGETKLFYMKKVALVTPPTGGILLHFVTEDMVQEFVNQHLKVKDADPSSSGAANKQGDLLEQRLCILKQRRGLREGQRLCILKQRRGLREEG